MKISVATPIILACTLSALGLAQSPANPAANFASGSGMPPQIKNANSPQQYQALASYYRQQEKSFRDQQAAEKLVWEQRMQNTTSTAQKYPRPVDSAHYLYDYYGYKADRSAQQAAHYEQLAGTP